MSSAASPLVSVILPVKDGERFITEALQSVLSQAAAARLEIIVIDDGSTDGTADCVRRVCPEAIILRTASVGPAAARNAGLRRGHGDFFAFIDHDDLWPPGKLEGQLARMQRDPGLGITIGRSRYEWLAERKVFPVRFAYDDQSLYQLHLGSCLMRRYVFDRIGGFDESLRFAEDGDLFLRAREAGIVIRASEDLGLIYRLHRSNMTRDKTMTELNNFEVLRRSLRRREAANQLGSMRKLTDLRE